MTMAGAGESWRDVQVKADGLMKILRESGGSLARAIGAARRGDCHGANSLLQESRAGANIVEQWALTFGPIMPEHAKVDIALRRLGIADRRTHKRVARMCGW